MSDLKRNEVLSFDDGLLTVKVEGHGRANGWGVLAFHERQIEVDADGYHSVEIPPSELRELHAFLGRVLKLSAAPGEPCAAADLSAAWTKYVAVFGEEPHGTEKQMGALLALVTTPQPAAGWDENCPYYDERFEKGVQHVVDMLARNLAVDNYVAGDGSEDYDCDLWQTILNILAAKGLYDKDECEFAALRREAPAPAEGVTDNEDRSVGGITWHSSDEDSGPDVGISVYLGNEQRLWLGEITKKLFEESGHFDSDGGWFIIWYKPEPVLIAKCADEHDARAFVEHIASLISARPDTAEARLREALDLETIQTLLDLLNPLHGSLDEQTYDDKLRENFDAPADAEYGVNITARMERDLTQAVLILEDRKRQALSPPSGGDEAKESEGGKCAGGIDPGWGECPKCGATDDDECGMPHPSEPSPPADRREIVARIIEPNKWELIDAARAKGLDKWASDLAEPSLAKADAILAALDGGRDA